MGDLNEWKLMRDRLNAVSPYFCLAKWTQVTLHLHSGTNHSCHHPEVHPVPLNELKRDPSALHNTSYKKELRRKMKTGEKPTECDYCWNIEALGPEQMSDRMLKSSDDWSEPDFETIRDLPVNKGFNPRYVELSFSRTCNFKCSYCSANFSSSWAQELKRFGPYSNNSGAEYFNLVEEENNPYIDAFWKWWPTLAPDLKVLRITGGEPLLSPNTFRMLEELSLRPYPALEFAINSNLGVAPAIVDRFIKAIRPIIEGQKIKKFLFFTSLDGWGKRAEYARNGLNLQTFERNLTTILTELPTLTVTIMVTFNALSVTSFEEMLRRVIEYRRKFANENRRVAVEVDISYLRSPLQQAVKVLPVEYMAYIEQIVRFMEENSHAEERPWGFSRIEMNKMRRIQEWMRNPMSDQDLKTYQTNFFLFFREHDERRGVNFLETFPEMEAFWKLCRRQAGWERPEHLVTNSAQSDSPVL